MIDKILVKLAAQHEGFRSKPYLCTADKLTIGYGRNIEDVGISEEEALIMLENDLSLSEKMLNTYVLGFDKLNKPRQAVLIDMCFNLGSLRFLGSERLGICEDKAQRNYVSGFKKTLSKLEAAIQNNNGYDEVADEMLDSKWADQVKSRATRLSRMMRTGEW